MSAELLVLSLNWEISIIQIFHMLLPTSHSENIGKVLWIPLLLLKSTSLLSKPVAWVFYQNNSNFIWFWKGQIPVEQTSFEINCSKNSMLVERPILKKSEHYQLGQFTKICNCKMVLVFGVYLVYLGCSCHHSIQYIGSESHCTNNENVY